MNNTINKIDFGAFLRSFKQNLDGSFSFLLGAGASVSSGVQSASDCIWDWKKDIFLAQNLQFEEFLDIHSDFCKDKIQKWLDEQGVFPNRDSEEEYVFYAEKAYPMEQDRTKYFENLCADKTPYIGYKLLMLLNKYGVVKSVWTTNFDGLIERAAHQADLTPIAVTLDNPERISRNESKSELLYVALHGDYKYSKLKNTAQELDAQEILFTERLKSYFIDKNLVVIGYSGRDKSLMHTLCEAFMTKGCGRLYWCGYGNKITSEVQNFLNRINDSGREAVYVDTDGFDATLVSIMKFCYEDQFDKKIEIGKYLKGLSRVKHIIPFSVENTTFTGCAKTNLYPLIIPQDIFQFEIESLEGSSKWSFIKERIKGKDIIAAPYKKIVYAYGLPNSIYNVFSKELIGEIKRVPISLSNIKDNSTLKNIILKVLICSLSSNAGLRASMSKKIIWNEKESFQSNVFKAIKIDIVFINSEKYALISITPTLYFNKEGNYTTLQKQEITRSYIDKLYNKIYEETLCYWEAILFKQQTKISFDYPLNSGNGCFFKVSSNRGEALFNNPNNPYVITNDIILKRKIYEGIIIDEPLLNFSGSTSAHIIMDSNPMRGLNNNNPYDHFIASKFRDVSIHIGVVCPCTYSDRFFSFLNELQSPIKNDNPNSDYIQNYNGFSQIYASILNIPAINSQYWISCREEQDNSISLARNLCKYANQMATNMPGIIVTFFIPNSWSNHKSFKECGEVFDLHSYIKAFAAQHGFTTQIIEERTLTNLSMRKEIYWWLSLAFFVKAMRVPWTLANLDQNTAFAGIGYSVSKKQSGKFNIVIGCSHIYNSEGQGLRYKLSKIDNPILDRKNNPYLTYNEAYKLGVNIQNLFIQSMDKLPKRVVIHKRTPFQEDEIKGITEALAQANITNVDLITITIEKNIRCLDQFFYNGQAKNSNFPLRRGTCMKLSDTECLLWTHGVVDSIKAGRSYYSGGKGIPSPLRISKFYGAGSMKTICNEILGFTKMNWNSFNFYTKLPATIDTSNTLAQVGNMLDNYNGITYDYRYFI